MYIIDYDINLCDIILLQLLQIRYYHETRKYHRTRNNHRINF